MTRLLPVLGRILLTLLFGLLAIVALKIVWGHYEDDPWTRDGSLQADVVRVSSDVSGLVTKVSVVDNQLVRAGDVLFAVDQERYAAAVVQASASIVSTEAAIQSARADVAKARAALSNAEREQARYISLGNLVSQEERDQKVTAVELARASLTQAIAGVDEKNATLEQAKANREVSAINLKRSAVRAGVHGYVTGFSLRPGDYVTAGAAQFALLDTSSFYVVGYFEEPKLRRFHLGDQVKITLLGDERPLWGHVDSVSAGVADRQQNPSDRLLPNITPTFSWIRLSQRIPVRVMIDRVPDGVRLVAGRTATVTILPAAHQARIKSAMAPASAPAGAPANG